MIRTLIGYHGRKKNLEKTVNTVEMITLTLDGMRGSLVYKVSDEADKAELCRYRKLFIEGESVLELEKSVSCDTQTFIDLMNNCGVTGWDGFHGKHPRNVSDGIMFDFSATVNGGQTIHADGSANFPKGYHEFVKELNSMLAKDEKK